MSGFRKFLMRGNLIDLAVAVVVGVAFNAVVQSLIKNLIMPLIAAIAGKPNFGNLVITLHNTPFRYGDFLNALVAFVTISAVLYFLIVSPMTRIMSIADRKKEATTQSCPECLSEIPVGASRCMYCTAQLPAMSAGRPHNGLPAGPAQAPGQPGRHAAG
jgi:large conductance mechanosensitive channel